jgi:hypothetical protein
MPLKMEKETHCQMKANAPTVGEALQTNAIYTDNPPARNEPKMKEDNPSFCKNDPSLGEALSSNTFFPVEAEGCEPHKTEEKNVKYEDKKS